MRHHVPIVVFTATSMVLVSIGTSGCAPEPTSALREGAAEDDHNEPPPGGEVRPDEDDGIDTGGDTGDPPDTDDDPVTPSDELVCYPGADGAWETCLPLVSWETAWGDDYAYPEPLDGDPLYSAPLRFIDLNGAEASADPQLAPNFALSELMQSWKGRFALYQPHALEHLQSIRDAIGGPLTINSGYRNVTYNAGVGGAAWSRHLYGDAADMASAAASLDELAGLCADLGAGYVGQYESHVHCDWRDDDLEPGFYATDATLQSTAAGWRVEHADGPEGALRILWSAHDASGALLASHEGSVFSPPTATVHMRADVGGLRTLAVRLAAAEFSQ